MTEQLGSFGASEIDYSAWRPAEHGTQPRRDFVCLPADANRANIATSRRRGVVMTEIARMPAPETSSPRRWRVLYIVLGIFFGFIGVHNFYAARYWRGFVQLFAPVIIAACGLPGLALIGAHHGAATRAAFAAIDNGSSFVASSGAPVVGTILCWIAMALVVALPIWVILEIVTVTRDGHDRPMV